MSTENPKVGFVSLGCPKALVDSERILTQLRTEGYEISPSYEGAGLVVVNTCGFIDAAKAESLAAIGEALEENGKVIVTGCMGADGDQILDAYPQVLSVSGPQQYEQVVGAVHEYLPPKKDHDPFVDLVPPQGVKLTPRHYSYLKISEGCNHRCTFCIIPALRGDLDSRPVGSVMDEAQRLVDAGVKELLVVSQDTSAYGVDQKYKLGFWQGRPMKTRLKELCEALGSLGVWVRLHYVYPYPSVDAVIPLMAEGAIVPYLDIPLQHAHPEVLKMMKRPAASEKTMERIRKWREICPEIVIRSTFIVGFPGETEAHFEYLLDFLREARLDRVGCFTYSPVDGAPANELADPVPEEVKEDRLARFMEVQAEISAEKLQEKIGQEMDILIDHAGPDGAIGRTKGDAPEIDGEVHLLDVSGLEPGQVVRGRIIEADDHDLWAELV
ncbi:30S ribosomal protein S12 methylthiotransferase RimO [Oceanospirillum linum]|uniref:Ribosomal protein uS12 methylthiotransferase RimO n=1 Tax=Oceanospirillum linum TaxID=966 RepID=A0A1T1HAK9_OCELI|nr:30S ribosomal protein S12 methylthiotransferase RimO [Oceanospirillum linum]OOV86898.1 ribosomal protein S12 methylthiotransferase [Oceanospirillum linum]SEG19512.1 SSU ribosomal protein S12P methylthiotransferase [Oleiphilus messinensis]SMP24263.1 SSU ribosomal protein S12P methylthiotransferase [Oceanospirillum linum]